MELKSICISKKWKLQTFENYIEQDDIFLTIILQLSSSEKKSHDNHAAFIYVSIILDMFKK